MQETAYRSAAKVRKDSRNQPQRNYRASRPVYSVNLGRLADAVGLDVLASSLGLGEAALLKVIQGAVGGQDYLAHIAHRLKEARLQPAWLNQTHAPIRPEFVNELLKLAASSVNLGPTRRHNFQTLVDAFEGRVDALADALDLVENSVNGIADGRLPLDDERFTHLNPRLMAAGFPDCWLDQPQAKVDPSWIPKLEAAAHETYAHELIEAAALRSARALSRPTQQPAEMATAIAAPANVPTVTIPANVESEQTPQQALFDAPSVETSVSTAPPKPDSASQLAASGSELPVLTHKETPMTPTKPALPAFTPGNFAGAGKPSSNLHLPRGVMSAGRSAVRAHQVASTTPAPAPQAKVTGPASTGTGSSTPVVAPRANTRGGKSPMTKEQSLARADALEKLLSTARRGVKVTLWRELLGSSLPYWGNIRHGTVMMRDEMADEITRHMGLPKGWLDHPTFPPATLADWVTNAEAPLPKGGSKPASTASAPAAVPATAAPTSRRPFARTPLSTPTAVLSTTTIPPAAPPKLPGGGIQAAEQPSASITVSPQAHAVTAQSLSSPVNAFTWQPVMNPQPQPIPGPGVQALTLVLNQLSLEGKFTDQDAMRLITTLMAPR